MGRTLYRLLATVGLVICIVWGWSAAQAGAVLLRSPGAPLPTTVAAAPDQRWVVLDDAVVDCRPRAENQRVTFVLANDRSGANPFLAQLVGAGPCHPSPGERLDGVFVGRFTRDFLRERQRLDLPPGDDLRVFSQAQAPRHLWRSLGRRLTWFGLGLLLLLLAIRGLWRTER